MLPNRAIVLFGLSILSIITYVFSSNEIGVEYSDYQIVSLSNGPDVDDLLVMAIFRVKFDRPLYYDRTPIQNLPMTPDIILTHDESSNPYYYFDDIQYPPASMLLQAGTVKLTCPTSDHMHKNEYPECSNEHCIYRSFPS